LYLKYVIRAKSKLKNKTTFVVESFSPQIYNIEISSSYSNVLQLIRSNVLQLIRSNVLQFIRSNVLQFIRSNVLQFIRSNVLQSFDLIN
jgi:hypothetical protein